MGALTTHDIRFDVPTSREFHFSIVMFWLTIPLSKQALRGEALPKEWIRPDQYVYLLIHIVIFLLGLLIAYTGNPLLVAIGTSISATGVTGWAIFFYIRTIEDDAEFRKSLHKLGIIGGYSARSVPIRSQYEGRFAAAREQIDFCGFGLRALREDFRAQFPQWISHCKVRILLIHPDAPGSVPAWTLANQRDLEEGNEVGRIRADVVQFLASCRELKRTCPDRFDIRLYTCIPAVNVCRIDDEIFWGPYLVGEQSRNTPTILVGKGGDVFQAMAAHFDRIWTDPKLSTAAYKCRRNGQFESVVA